MIPILALATAFLVVDPYAFEQSPLKDGAVLIVIALAIVGASLFGRRSPADKAPGSSRAQKTDAEPPGTPLQRAFLEPLPTPLLFLAGLILLAVISAIVEDSFLPGIRDATRWTSFLILTKFAMDDTWHRPIRVPFAILVCGTVAGLIAIAQALGFDPIFENPGNEAVSLFGNTNQTGEVMAPVAVLSFFLTTANVPTLSRMARVALPIAVAALMLSQSRAAILGAGAGIVGMMMFGALFSAEARQGALRNRILLVSAGVLIAALAGGPSILGAKKISDTEASVASLEYPTNKQRLLLAQGAVDMWRAEPMFGHGSGQFRAAFPPYRHAEEAQLKTLMGAFSEAEDPHNLYLLLLTEGGLVALLLFLGFAIPAFLGLRNSGLYPVTDTRRQIAPGIAAAFLSLVIIGAFRSIVTEPPAAILFFITAGILIALGGAADGRSTRSLTYVPYLYLVGFAAIGVSLFGSNLALANGQRRMQKAVATGSLADAMEIDRALAFGESLQPDNPYLLQIRASTLDVLARESKDPAPPREIRFRTLQYYPWHAPTISWFLADSLHAGDLSNAEHWRRRLLQSGPPSLDDPDTVRQFLARQRRLDAFGPYLLARAKARIGTLTDLTSYADQAEEEGDNETALSCLKAFLAVRPFAPEIASRAAEILQGRGEVVPMRKMQHRVHLAFGLEHLQRGGYADAAESAELARAKQNSPEADALFAVARAAQKDTRPLKNIRENGSAELEDDFRAALRELRGNGDLTEAINALTN